MPEPIPSPQFAAAYRDFMVTTLEHEHDITLKVLAQVRPGNWRPDPKSRTALELAWHIVSSELWSLRGIAALKFEGGDAAPPSPGTVQDIVKLYQDEFPRAIAGIKALTPGQLAHVTDFFGMKFPLFVYLNFCLVHSVHHRGQLSTYLRPLGGTVPDIYGGSADEPWQG